MIMLVGPTECGKSTFAENVLIPRLKFTDERSGYMSNVQYFSSDKIRQDLLGHAYDKYDENMLEASKQAFEMLYYGMRQVTSYPINADFVVVDTIGLASEHCEEVRKIAEENGYHVSVIIFDYRKRDDYYISERSKKIISNHLRRLKEEVLPTVSKEGYESIVRIKEKNFLDAADSYQITIEDKELFIASQLDQDKTYVMVGDIHEQVDALKVLIEKNGYTIDEQGLMVAKGEKSPLFVLVGDYVDKGGNTEETISFLYKNKQHFHFILGNHEYFVYLWLSGEKSVRGIEQETLDNYFTSIKVLEKDEVLRNKFLELYSMATPFAHYNGRKTPSFYVTHAPTPEKYIGKVSKEAIRHQRNFRLMREEPIEPQLEFLQKEAVFNYPYYFFGHVMTQKPIRIGKTIGIDTGAGNLVNLTTAQIKYGKVIFQHQQISETPTEEIPILFPYKRKEPVIVMDERLQKKINYFSKHAINYFAGTISPADKQGETLESIEQGLNFFLDKGVQQVVLQPKYMGSRCTIYLFKDIEKCYATSRRGFLIKQVDMQPIYQHMVERLGSYMEENKIEMLILDGELMPWKALGEDLINQSFVPISTALTIEERIMEESGFYQQLQDIQENPKYDEYKQDRNQLNKKELIDKMGSNAYQTFSQAHKLSNYLGNAEDQFDAIMVYKEQVAIYGADMEMHYKPFAILKIVYTSEKEAFPDMSTSEMYQLLNDDAFVVVDLENSEDYANAIAYFNTLTTERQMEGVVIKPQHTEDMLKAAPHMKVRNPEYLSIIYGYNYRNPIKYQKLLKNKKIGRKVRASIDEYNLGQRLLAIPYKEISVDNKEYTDVVAKLLGEMERSENIDPRL